MNIDKQKMTTLKNDKSKNDKYKFDKWFEYPGVELMGRCLMTGLGLSALCRILLYGCIIWCQILINKYAENIIQKVQRIAAVHIKGAFRTTSNDALNVLAGLPPLHYVVMQRVALQFFNIQKELDLRWRLDWANTCISLAGEKHTHKCAIDNKWPPSHFLSNDTTYVLIGPVVQPL